MSTDLPSCLKRLASDRASMARYKSPAPAMRRMNPTNTRVILCSKRATPLRSELVGTGSESPNVWPSLCSDDSGTVVLRGHEEAQRPLRYRLPEEKFFLAKFFDGIAEAGGFFEFEFPRGFA